METIYTKSVREACATIRAEAEKMRPWTPEETNTFTRTARREYLDHSYAHGRRRDPDNCAACALQVLPEPNYAGWLRVYIQAGIKPNTKAAFKEIERARTKNPQYFEAILRDIATYKPRFIYPPNHEWTDNEKAQAGEKF